MEDALVRAASFDVPDVAAVTEDAQNEGMQSLGPLSGHGVETLG